MNRFRECGRFQGRDRGVKNTAGVAHGRSSHVPEQGLPLHLQPQQVHGEAPAEHGPRARGGQQGFQGVRAGQEPEQAQGRQGLARYQFGAVAKTFLVCRLRCRVSLMMPSAS